MGALLWLFFPGLRILLKWNVRSSDAAHLYKRKLSVFFGKSTKKMVEYYMCAKYSAICISTVTCDEYCDMCTVLCHGLSNVPRAQYCAMGIVLCHVHSTVPCAQYCDVHSTVPWSQYCAMGIVLCHEDLWSSGVFPHSLHLEVQRRLISFTLRPL